MKVSIGQELIYKPTKRIWRVIDIFGNTIQMQCVIEGYHVCNFSYEELDRLFYDESEEVKVESKITIPCDDCVHKGICKHEDMTRDYIGKLLSESVPRNIKAKIKVFEVECELYKREEK